MSRLVSFALAAAASLVAASAAAQDLRIPPKVDAPLLEDVAGQPWWREMARCTGFMLSAAESYQRQGRAAQAASTQQTAEGLYDDALRRLAADRNLAEEPAKALLRPQVRVGLQLADRTAAAAAAPRSAWNLYRSRCLDLRDAYASGKVYAVR